MRLAILASHPIQYQAPLFRALAAIPGLDVEVLFCSRWGLQPFVDPGFGQTLAWDVPLVGGYDHRFLQNFHPRGGPQGFFNLLNPGAAAGVLRGKYDAVLIHGWAFATNWLCWAASTLRGVPLLLRGESSFVLDPPQGRTIRKRILLSVFFQRVSAFVSIGSQNSAFYRSFGIPDQKIFLAPYSVDNSFFLSGAKKIATRRREVRAAIGVRDDAPVILFAGKFQRKKRPMDLLEAYRRIEAESGAWLAFIGDGELRADLERYVEIHQLKRVRFLGFKNQTEMPEAYGAADVLVLPSDFEPWGLVVNEAMCFGLPVITSDRVGACADLVRNDYNGYVFPTGDVMALSHRLRQIIENTPLRLTMAEHSREMISQWGLDQTAAGIAGAALEVRRRLAV
jgi:glycosyltransferase involved in cell wall biosynthesis